MSSPLETRVRNTRVHSPWKKGGALAIVSALSVAPTLVHQKPTPDQIQMQMASFSEVKPESVLQKMAANAGALAAAKANVCLFALSPAEIAACNQVNGSVTPNAIPLPEAMPKPAAPAVVETPTTTSTTTTAAPPPTTTTTTPAAENTYGITPTEYAQWLVVNKCEEGGNWAVRGSMYSGGLGISNYNWTYYSAGMGFPASAADATPYQQMAVDEKLMHGLPIPDQDGCKAY